MLNTTFRTYKHLIKVLNTTNLQINIPKQYSCLCGQVYLKDGSRDLRIRVHSTQSDQHRQKVVIETSTPNVIEKLNYEKVLPLKEEDKLWRDRIDPYLKLARWDKPIGIYLLFWPCSWSIAAATITSGVELPTACATAGLFLLGAGLMRGAGCTLNDMWDRDIDRQSSIPRVSKTVLSLCSWSIAVTTITSGVATACVTAGFFLLGAGLMQGAGCTLRDIWDRNINRQVERTASRPLVTGVISPAGATAFLAAQLSAALAVLLQLNCYSVALGASSMALVITYPLAKRFTNYPQVFLGATFNWGALLGFSAITGTIDPHICLPLYIGALSWTVIYDTIYAHQDKYDDARIGIKSTALTFGEHTKPLLSCALALSGSCFLYAGHACALSAVHAAATAAYVAVTANQIYTLDINNPADCAKKFNANAYIGLIMLLGIIGGGYGTYLENRRKNADKNTRDNAKSCVFG